MDRAEEAAQIAVNNGSESDLKAASDAIDEIKAKLKQHKKKLTQKSKLPGMISKS
ncbi:hypothetical protein [Lacticaseibacillus saniviri]|uniref:hypothetical protein n=1 Tax=Lacticaseibacillus saniviri TaxID=931533 RepID=UPI0012E30B3B|nr:hypothetical protein [Lacticaseibacillus saniviri]